jgi:hypothetical protein
VTGGAGDDVIEGGEDGVDVLNVLGINGLGIDGHLCRL